MRLLIFGLGYTASRLAARLADRGWRITAGPRDGRDAPLAFADSGRMAFEIANATHILSSVPPGEADPVLAGYPSAYGHDFAGPPSRRHRFDEWSSRIRPAWVRQHSYAIQRRLRPIGDEHGGLLSPDYMGRVIDLEFPAMRRFFRMERVTDAGLWRRIACLEYLAARLDIPSSPRT